MKALIKKLSHIQKELKAPKNQFNSFGNYNYRNCEDILEAIKPYLDDETILTISDEIIFVEGRFYVKATATFYHGVSSITASAFAREVEEKKKMDAPQCTGSSSSYARKYALNALFLIDDTKDPDSNEFSNENKRKEQYFQNNNNNQNGRNNKKNDWHTRTLRDLISSITSNFKDKTKVNIICQSLNVKDLSVLAGYNNEKKKEIINHLKKNYK